MCVHAAGESSPGPSISPNTYAVVLSVSSELELLELESRLSMACVPFVAFRETDSPYAGQLMSIGVCPTTDQAVRKLLRNYPLLKE